MERQAVSDESEAVDRLVGLHAAAQELACCAVLLLLHHLYELDPLRRGAVFFVACGATRLALVMRQEWLTFGKKP